jgi:hypothetical protein
MRRKAISLSKAGGLFLAGLTVRAVAFHPAPCVAPALGGDLPLGLGSRSAPQLRQTAAMSGVRAAAGGFLPGVPLGCCLGMATGFKAHAPTCRGARAGAA